MNSIADVLALTPGPSWHESVAIVQEIAAHLEPGQPLPAPEDLLLESDGSVTFGFAGESARPQVADLASLLDTLLQRADAPQALRDLVSENARDEPAHAGIASFTKALAFYERPNRRSDLQALAGRLEGRSLAAQAAQGERAVAEIRERLGRQGDEETKAKQPASPVAAHPKAFDRVRAIARARALAIAAAVVLAAVGVSAMTVLRGWNGSNHSAAAPAPSSANASEQAAANATDADTSDSHAVSTARAAAEHHPIGTSARGVERNHSKSASRSASEERSPAPRHGGPATSFKPSRAGLAPVRPLPATGVTPASSGLSTGERATMAVSRVEEMTAALDATYTSANSEVTPPVWNRRQLPSEPAPNAKTGYFEIVIDTNGDVESVRLISPTRRYEERMLMAAAKAWKFRPARLNGEPVKYRMRVPITLTWTVDQ